MRNLDKLFKNRIINKSKLIEFGFKEEQNQYTYQEQIPNTNFLIKIFLSSQSKESIVIDTSFDEEFVLVDVNEPVGEYIAKIREYYDNLLKKIINRCTLVDAFTAKQSKLIIKYVKEKYNKELEFLWEDTPDCAIWRNDTNDTWFGLLMVVKKSKFIDNSTGEVEVLNIRFKKGETDSIVDNIGIFKAYHMNKNSWISIILDDSVSIDKIFKLLDDSYTLSVNSKKPKKKTIGFYYEGDLDIKPQNKDFAKIKDIKNIYNILNTIWSKETCAPRLRKEWTKRNNTVGQCSITAFLVQDIFGGKVYGVKLDSGNIHCFNVFDNLVVDLTSRQLKNKQIEYKLNLPQDRTTHFSKQEKFDRYNTLKNALIDYLKNINS